MTQAEFEQIVETLRPRLIQIASKVVGTSDAEDVVQRSLVDAWCEGDWRSMDAPALKDRLASKTAADAKNYVESACRQQSHEATYAELSPPREAESEDDLALRLDLDRVLSSLEPQVREAVEAVYIRGESIRAVARRLGLSKSDLHRRMKAVLAGTNPSSARSLITQEEN